MAFTLAKTTKRKKTKTFCNNYKQCHDTSDSADFCSTYRGTYQQEPAKQMKKKKTKQNKKLWGRNEMKKLCVETKEKIFQFCENQFYQVRCFASFKTFQKIETNTNCGQTHKKIYFSSKFKTKQQ